MATSAAAISTINIKPADEVVVLASDGVQFRGVVDLLAQNDIGDQIFSVHPLGQNGSATVWYPHEKVFKLESVGPPP
jgi:hypothetical protein